MTRELPEVLNELFRFGSVTEKATEEFKDMKHNADLCPAVTQQLNRLLESYLKYDAVAYDVQGLHDQGTDVLLKYYPNPDGEDNPWYAIAIQIKSYDDLKKPDYVKDLMENVPQFDKRFVEDRSNSVPRNSQKLYNIRNLRTAAVAFILGTTGASTARITREVEQRLKNPVERADLLHRQAKFFTDLTDLPGWAEATASGSALTVEQATRARDELPVRAPGARTAGSERPRNPDSSGSRSL